MSVIRVAQYSNAEEALVAKSMLQAYGIPASFPEEHTNRLKWAFLQGASHCHVEVPSSCLDDAQFLLEDSTAELSDFDEYDRKETQLFRRKIYLALILTFGPFGLFPVVDHLYHWIKRVRSKSRPRPL